MNKLKLQQYFIFGKHPNGMVDVASFENDTLVGPISRKQAENLISDRDKLLQFIEELENS